MTLKTAVQQTTSYQLGFLILLCDIEIICFYVFEWSAYKLAGFEAKFSFHYKQTFNTGFKCYSPTALTRPKVKKKKKVDKTKPGHTLRLFFMTNSDVGSLKISCHFTLQWLLQAMRALKQVTGWIVSPEIKLAFEGNWCTLGNKMTNFFLSFTVVCYVNILSFLALLNL